MTVSAAALDPAAETEALVKGARTSFYWAMRLLPRPRREAMYAIYAFCRAVDDIADAEGPPEPKLAGLAQWRRNIDAVYAGRPVDAIGQALLAAHRRFDLPREEFDEMIAGMEMDVHGPIVAPSLADLTLYCRRVAGAVGLLSISVFGAPGARRFALALGEALQLTNILRDLAEDAAIGRLYLPREALTAAGITEPSPAVLSDPRAAPQVAQACRAVAAQAEARFAEAAAELERHDRRRLVAAIAMMAIYRRLLAQLIAGDFRRFDVRPRVSSGAKLAIALRALVLARP